MSNTDMESIMAISRYLVSAFAHRKDLLQFESDDYDTQSNLHASKLLVYMYIYIIYVFSIYKYVFNPYCGK